MGREAVERETPSPPGAVSYAGYAKKPRIHQVINVDSKPFHVVGNMLDLRAIECSRLTEALDGLRCGVILPSERGAILHANKSGEVENGATVEPLRRRQTKGAETGYVRPTETALHLDATMCVVFATCATSLLYLRLGKIAALQRTDVEGHFPDTPARQQALAEKTAACVTMP